MDFQARGYKICSVLIFKPKFHTFSFVSVPVFPGTGTSLVSLDVPGTPEPPGFPGPPGFPEPPGTPRPSLAVFSAVGLTISFIFKALSGFLTGAVTGAVMGAVPPPLGMVSSGPGGGIW